MPRDKTANHDRIVRAAMREFQENGFEQASMKHVADAVGLTSAALYRHFSGKQEMFASLVQPAVDLLQSWTEQHIASSYDLLDGHHTDKLWDFDGGYNDARMILDVMYQQPEAFRLLLFCAAGTPYENYVHGMVERTTQRMLCFLEDCKARGIPVREVRPDEMHMLVSAYFAALIQPIEHGYAQADAERYLKTILDFFTPGWRKITGL